MFMREMVSQNENPLCYNAAKQEGKDKNMSGHSKWATIKRKKGAADAKRGQLFTRLAREIAMAAREGGGDADSNFKLRLAVDKARSNNMPKDNIQRAIDRGTGDGEGGALEQIMYEGYAAQGVAVIIETVTDNRNRTVSDLRRTLTKAGGSLGESNSVAWQFQRKAYFAFTAGDRSEDSIFEMAVDAGADDVQFADGMAEIFAPVEAFKAVSDKLRAVGIQPEEAELRMEPTNLMELSPEATVRVMKGLDEIEELDDVQKVYSNLHISDEAMAALEA
jgi:YebC/PmpR family DNA-binding regulatory protein